MVTVKAIQCPKCGDIIYSRAVHDFHGCTCGSVYVDGGFDYTHIGKSANIRTMPKILKKRIKATKQELYNDWNFGTNKFGWIKKGN